MILEFFFFCILITQITILTSVQTRAVVIPLNLNVQGEQTDLQNTEIEFGVLSKKKWI